DMRDLHAVPTRRSSDRPARRRNAGLYWPQRRRQINHDQDADRYPAPQPGSGQRAGLHTVAAATTARLPHRLRLWPEATALVSPRSEEHTSELQSRENLV